MKDADSIPLNPHLERRELDSKGLIDIENHHHQTPHGFFQAKVPV